MTPLSSLHLAHAAAGLAPSRPLPGRDERPGAAPFGAETGLLSAEADPQARGLGVRAHAERVLAALLPAAGDPV